MKRIYSIICIAVVFCILAVTSCSSESADDSSSQTPAEKLHNGAKEITDKDYGFQLENPENGEEVALLHTSMGDIYIRLFDEYAPKAVENFKTHINNGYYNGLIFHRVINDFMIQGGDPDGTSTGGESIWGSPFEDEFCDKLSNIRGALAMANSGPNTNGSQFFINQAKAENFDKSRYDYDATYANYELVYQTYCNQYPELKNTFPDVDAFINNYIGGIAPNSNYVPDEIWKLYEQQGGNINLDGAWRDKGGHTVFGQVVKGMDVVDAIAAVSTDSNDKPIKNVVITSAEIIKWSDK